MPEIELNLGNSKVKFEDIVANGLSRFFVIVVCLFFLCLFKKNGLSRFTETSVFSFYVLYFGIETDWRVHWQFVLKIVPFIFCILNKIWLAAFHIFYFIYSFIFVCIRYGWQVHRELCQVWPCKQLDQAEHGLRADAVDRWECILPNMVGKMVQKRRKSIVFEQMQSTG